MELVCKQQNNDNQSYSERKKWQGFVVHFP